MRQAILKVLLISSSVVKMSVSVFLLFKVFILNQEIALVAHIKFQKIMLKDEIGRAHV